MTSNSYDPKRFDHSGADFEASLATLWKQLHIRFPTEEDCLEEIYRRAALGAKCPHCQGTNMYRSYGQRTSFCLTCKKPSWCTANTFFHRIRTARPWLTAIWFMEHGLSVNSFRFHQLVGIAYSSALNIFRKITTAIQNQMGDDAIAVHSTHFLPAVGKRSRVTPTGEGPSSEQQIIEEPTLGDGEEGSNLAATEKTLEEMAKTYQLSELAIRRIYDLLSETSTDFDLLCQRTSIPAGKLLAVLSCSIQNLS